MIIFTTGGFIQSRICESEIPPMSLDLYHSSEYDRMQHDMSFQIEC